MRPTTIVVVAGSSAAAPAAVVAAAGRAGNVTAVSRERDGEGGTRVVWAELERVQSTYAITEADPLEPLCQGYVDAWRERRLERFDAAALEMGAPCGRTDFYLVLDDGSPGAGLDHPDTLRREWYLGVVARAAPSRVVAVPPGAPGAALAPEAAVEVAARCVLGRLAALPAGPELPDTSELLELARRRVPGQA